MIKSNKVFILTIIINLYLIAQVTPLYKQTSINEYQIIPNQNLIKKKQITFSPYADKIAVIYTNQFQNQTYIKVFHNDGESICQNSSPDYINHDLVGFSFDSGPITLMLNSHYNTYTPIVWSAQCRIQQAWSKTSLQYGFQVQISKDWNQSYISFMTQKNISEYEIIKQKIKRMYFTGINQKFYNNFVYSQNHQYMMVQAYNSKDNSTLSSSRLVGFDCQTGQQKFSIKQPIYPLKFAKNNTRIIGQNQVTKNIYEYDFDGHYKLIINIRNQNYDFIEYKFCTAQSFLLISFYEKQQKAYKINVYNTNPDFDNSTSNDLKQVFTFDSDQYGNITKFICQNNKLAILNDKGYVRIYEYQAQNQQQDYQLVYLWTLAGLMIIALIMGAIARFNCKFTRQNKIQLQYKESLIQAQPNRNSQNFIIDKRLTLIKQQRQNKQEDLIHSEIFDRDNRLSKDSNMRMSLVLNQEIGSDKDLVINQKLRQQMVRNSLNAQRKSWVKEQDQKSRISKANQR